MRYLVLALLMLPTAFFTVGGIVGIVINRPFFGVLGLPRFFIFIPVLSLATSIALCFVFPSAKEWKVAAIINAIPFILIFFVFVLFWIVGYNG